MLIIQIAAILILTLILIKAADVIVTIIDKISSSTKSNSFVVAAVLLALTTSFPELTVGITSAFLQVPNLSLGNIIGANIANISLVLGVGGLVGGVVHFKHTKFITRDILTAFLLGSLPLLLLWDRQLTRIDGAILILAYVAYIAGFFDRFFRKEEPKTEANMNDSGNFLKTLWLEVKDGKNGARLLLFKFLIATVALLVSARFLVQLAVMLAEPFGVPVFLMGLIVVSVGTTLPEMSVAYRAAKKNEGDTILGNALGTIPVNALLILGAVSLIHPVTVVARREYLLAGITFVLIFLLFWFFVRSTGKLHRWEAGILLLVYIVFVALAVSGFKFF